MKKNWIVCQVTTWCIGLPEDVLLLLLTSMYIQSDLSCVDSSFAPHGPDHVQHSCSSWHFSFGHYFPILAVNMIIQFLFDCLFILTTIWGLHGFMQVHYVRVGTGSKSHWTCISFCCSYCLKVVGSSSFSSWLTKSSQATSPWLHCAKIFKYS